MDSVLNFAKENYLILLILGGFFLLALIGYLYDRYQNRDIKIAKDDKTDDAILTESLMEEQPTEGQGQVQMQGPVNTPVEIPQPVQEQQASAPTPTQQSNEEEVPQINGLEG